MYGLTAKQIKTRGIISVVLAVILSIIAVIAGKEVHLSGADDVLILVLTPLMIAWQFFAILINWKQMLKGFIAPIPVISYCIETIKALFVMVPKALFWALQQREA